MGTKHLPDDKRREQILIAAFYLFNKKGYYETKMDDIVIKSKLSKGSIYRFFRSKRELFLELFEYVVSKLENEVECIGDLEGHPKEQLSKIVEIFLRHLKEKKSIFMADVKFWGMASRDKEFRNEVRNLYKRWTKRFESLFNKGIEQGEFTNIDPKSTTIALIALFDGFILKLVGLGESNIKEEAGIVLNQFIKNITS